MVWEAKGKSGPLESQRFVKPSRDGRFLGYVKEGVLHIRDFVRSQSSRIAAE